MASIHGDRDHTFPGQIRTLLLQPIPAGREGEFGVSSFFVRKVGNGKMPPTLGQIEMIGRYLDLSGDKLTKFAQDGLEYLKDMKVIKQGILAQAKATRASKKMAAPAVSPEEREKIIAEIKAEITELQGWKALGGKLRRLRNAMGYEEQTRMKEAAREAKVSEGLLRRIEAGMPVFSSEKLQQVLKFYKLDVANMPKFIRNVINKAFVSEKVMRAGYKKHLNKQGEDPNRGERDGR